MGGSLRKEMNEGFPVLRKARMLWPIAPCEIWRVWRVFLSQAGKLPGPVSVVGAAESWRLGSDVIVVVVVVSVVVVVVLLLVGRVELGDPVGGCVVVDVVVVGILFCCYFGNNL